MKNTMPPIWKSVLLGSGVCLDSEEFISKIFTILGGDGNWYGLDSEA